MLYLSVLLKTEESPSFILKVVSDTGSHYIGCPDFRKALHKKTTKFPPVSLK